MRGAVVSNAYLRGGKYSEPADMLRSAARGLGVELDPITNADAAATVGGWCRDYDFVLFWDKDVACAENIELSGTPVFNSPSCIRVCDDKALTHLALRRHGVPSIDTYVCPMSFSGYDDLSFLDRPVELFGFPLVVKDRFGSFGQQVRLARDMDSLEAMFSGPYVPRVLQPYVECGAADVRAEVVGGRVVASVLRRGPEGDFRSNSTIGGRMEPHRITPEEEELAIRAAESVGADFAGVDVIRVDGGPAVCEVNSNAHMRNLLECTGRDVSADIVRHVLGTLGRCDGVLDPLRPLRPGAQQVLRPAPQGLRCRSGHGHQDRDVRLPPGTYTGRSRLPHPRLDPVGGPGVQGRQGVQPVVGVQGVQRQARHIPLGPVPRHPVP